MLKKILLNYQLNNDIIIVSNIIKAFIVSHKILFISSLVIIFIGIFLVSIYSFQRSIIYFPNYYEKLNDKLRDLNQYEEVSINNKYKGWFKYNSENTKTIIYYGGNAQSSALVFNSYHEKEWSYLQDYNFIMIDYPGFGLSSDKPNEEALFLMAKATYEYVNNDLNISSENIIVMGYSLGSGVATYIASTKDVSSLILVAPYSSMTDIYNRKLPIFYGPLKSLIKDKYDSYSYAKAVTCNTLIISSKKDKVISYKLSNKLLTNIVNANIEVYDHLEHNEFFDDKQVVFKLNEFLMSN